MNCDRCPHMARIRAALSPCQACEAGRLHGQYNITNETADWAMGHRAKDDHTPQTGVTALDAKTEDAMRRVMADLFALDPIELLLVQHVMRGGSYAGFAAPLHKLLKRLQPKEAELAGHKRGFRSLAHSWAKTIVEKMPAMAKVFGAEKRM